MLGNVDGVFSGSEGNVHGGICTPKKHTISRLLGAQKPIWTAVYGARRSHLGKYARNARGASSESNKILRDDGITPDCIARVAPQKATASETLRLSLERRGFVIEAGTVHECGCAVSARRREMNPVRKAA
jgi:hypothetical protein